MKILDVLAGYKTYIASAIGVLVALNSVFHWVSPEIQNAVLVLAGALGLYGVRRAIAKMEENQRMMMK